MSTFVKSFQPEQIMQAEKDQNHIREIENKIFDILEYLHPNIINYRMITKHKNKFRIFCALLYYLLTTQNGIKTFGEEYCNIRQFNFSDFDQFGVPVRKIRALKFVIFVVFGKILLDQLKSFYSKKVNNIDKPLSNQLPQAEQIIENLNLLHQGIFFVHNGYYQFSKRLAGIDHIFTRASPTHGIDFKVLGRFVLVQLMIEFCSFSYRLIKSMRTKQENKEIIQESVLNTRTQTCSLCMDNLMQISVTSCGHLFCWDCILPYTIQKQQCPQCRAKCLPNTVIRLINF